MCRSVSASSSNKSQPKRNCCPTSNFRWCTHLKPNTESCTWSYRVAGAQGNEGLHTGWYGMTPHFLESRWSGPDTAPAPTSWTMTKPQTQSIQDTKTSQLSRWGGPCTRQHAVAIVMAWKNTTQGALIPICGLINNMSRFRSAWRRLNQV